MYMDGVRFRTFQPMVRRFAGGPQTQAPLGMKFSTPTGPSLTNAEMRAVTEWRFGKSQPSANRRMKWDAYRNRWVPTL